VKVLVTSSRNPFALDMIRKLAEQGHTVYASDPRTLVAHDDASLREAIGQFPEYFARAAFSRGGVALLTNTGPLAGAVSVDDCHPSDDQPWLVQEFVSPSSATTPGPASPSSLPPASCSRSAPCSG
jgi:hypothetical protein